MKIVIVHPKDIGEEANSGVKYVIYIADSDKKDIPFVNGWGVRAARDWKQFKSTDPYEKTLTEIFRRRGFKI